MESKLGVVVCAFPKMMANKLANELMLQRGIGTRYGCHCAHIIVKQLLGISPGIEKFQRIIQTLLPKLRLPGMLRVSIGLENTEEEIDILIETLKKISPKTSATAKQEVPVMSKSEVKQKIKEFTRAVSLKVYGECE